MTERIASMIASYAAELDALEAYPERELVDVIREVGFTCTCCGRCCTRAFNDHVFLLEEDAERVLEMEPAALMPAPNFEFCDREGRFYVPGYALRTQEDGRCVFLSAEDRCTVYDRRMSICRVYPYMLHREADEEGCVDWRQISGLNLHGEYEGEIGEGEAREIARAVVAYERAFLTQEVAFLETLRAYFSANGLRHVQKVYDRQMARFEGGEVVEVMVFFRGGFSRTTARCTDYGIVPVARGKRR